MAKKKTASKTQTKPASGPQTSPRLVKMVHPSGKKADVHPDEVENFKRGNFREVSEG